VSRRLWPFAWKTAWRRRPTPDLLGWYFRLRESQRIALLAAVLFVVSALITLLILGAGARSRSPAEAAGGNPAAESSGGAAAAVSNGGGRGALSVGDFLLEDPQREEKQTYLSRPRTPRWSEEQVQRYWVPLKDVILDIVSRQSDHRIDQILEDVK
jgi:hypothetical protein